MASDNEVIIVGAGHNGLVAAGYLARAGVSVQVLERRHVVGGAAVTEEWFPGYRLSSCSYLCHALQNKVIDDLELHEHGFHVYPIDPSLFMPLPNGKHITMWHDDRKTEEEIRRTSPNDADAWLRWIALWERANRILGGFVLSPPPTLAQLVDRAKELGEEELLGTLLTVPVKDLIERYFESPEMKTMSCGHIELGDITAPGSAIASTYFNYGRQRGNRDNTGIVRGGMGSITQAMARSAEAHGASIRTDAEVRRILTADGRAIGVELADGQRIEGNIVVSNADPKRTFLKLLDPAALDDDFLADVRALKTNSASLKFHSALSGLPDFSGYLGAEFDPKHVAMTWIRSSMEQFMASWDDARNGRISREPLIGIQIPSVYDPTVAPEGHHVMSMWVYYQPPHLKESSWADKREEVGELLIDQVTKYAPNFRDILVDWVVLTPEDIEARIGLTDGNIRHVDMIPQQMQSRRPLPGWSHYRAPIEGLYMCGAGTHPGGEVTGAPGHNAAHVILEDIGLSD